MDLDWRDPQIEFREAGEVEPLRWAALRWQVEHARGHSAFHRERLQSVDPGSLRAPGDLRRIPFTTRADLAAEQERMACLPRERWADVSRTSGSTGRPIYIPASLADLERIEHFVARGMAGFGLREGQSAAILLPLDEMINPPVILEPVLRHHYRCLALRIGAAARERQLQYLQDLGPEVVVGAPTPFLLLGQAAREAGLEPRDLGVRTAILMGQPVYGEGWRHLPVAERLRELWGCEVFSIYGATEWYSGLCECEAHAGHHVQWESVWTEIVDPGSGEPMPPGEVGELVFTTLYREAFPLVRYRTGDLTWMEEDPCACGRRSPRVMAVVGRTDDLLKIRGATVFPQQLEEAVASVPGVAGYLVEVEADGAGSDTLRVHLAVEAEFGPVAGAVRERVKERTRVAPVVVEASLEGLEDRWHSGGARKPRKIWDLRLPEGSRRSQIPEKNPGGPEPGGG